LRYINSLIDEEARILLDGKMTLEKEKKWLYKLIKQNKQAKNIAVVIEVEGKISGLSEIRIDHGRKSHVGTFGTGIISEYRNLGITKLAFNTLQVLAMEKGIKLIQSSYFSDNQASSLLHKSLGFKVCGRIPRSGRFSKKYLDEILLFKQVSQ